MTKVVFDIRDEDDRIYAFITAPLVNLTNAPKGFHVYKKKDYADDHRGKMHMIFANKKTKILNFWPVTVTFHRYYGKVAHKMDDDSLPTCFKYMRDKIAKITGKDDGDDGWTWKYFQTHDPERVGSMEIILAPTIPFGNIREHSAD